VELKCSEKKKGANATEDGDETSRRRLVDVCVMNKKMITKGREKRTRIRNELKGGEKKPIV